MKKIFGVLALAFAFTTGMALATVIAIKRLRSAPPQTADRLLRGRSMRKIIVVEVFALAAAPVTAVNRRNRIFSYPNNSGSFTTFAAIRRASLRVSSLAVARFWEIQSFVSRII